MSGDSHRRGLGNSPCQNVLIMSSAKVFSLNDSKAMSSQDAYEYPNSRAPLRMKLDFSIEKEAVLQSQASSYPRGWCASVTGRLLTINHCQRSSKYNYPYAKNYVSCFLFAKG